jgi:hypothetical protein
MAARIVSCGAVMSLACGSDDRVRPAPSIVYLSPAVIDAGVEVPHEADATVSGTPLLRDWCGSEDAGATDAPNAIAAISSAYLAAQLVVCRSMTEEMSSAQLTAWEVYIYDYSRVMAGCLQIKMPPPGGILAFGPANTAAVGVLRSPLSREDARLLIAEYLSAFVRALALDSDDRALVETHLWRTAEFEIDASLPVGLSVCAEGGDAGG